MYSRCVLVFDSEEGELADAALQLSAARFNVLYASYLDELLLTSREYADRVGAVSWHQRRCWSRSSPPC
jgi:hypothetical protein